MINFIRRIYFLIFPSRLQRNAIDGAKVSGNIQNIKLGDSVSLGGDVSFFATSEIEVGSHTMIGKEAMLHTSTHDYSKHPMWKVRIDRPIKVGTHVWIGARAVILPGIIVGDFAVIGSGSVVTSHVPENAVVAGNPARILCYRDPNSRNSKVENYPIGASVLKEGFLPLDRVCKKKEE